MTRKVFTLVMVMAIVGSLLTGCNPYKQIPPSSVGVVFDASTGVQQNVVKPGVVFQGWNDILTIYPTSIHNASYVRNTKEGERREDDSIVASTKEGAQLPLDITVVWHVDPANMPAVFTNFGTDNLEDIQKDFIRYAAIYSVNAVSGTKSIFDITSKDRAKFGPEAKAIITPLLEEYGLTCDDVYIGETWQSQDITELVKQRIEKSSELQTVTNNLTKARIDGQTLINNAQGTASINGLKAQQGPEAIELAKRKLLSTLIEKWDGEPSQVGDGGIPFINPELLKPTATSNKK